MEHGELMGGLAQTGSSACSGPPLDFLVTKIDLPVLHEITVLSQTQNCSMEHGELMGGLCPLAVAQIGSLSCFGPPSNFLAVKTDLSVWTQSSSMAMNADLAGLSGCLKAQIVPPAPSRLLPVSMVAKAVVQVLEHAGFRGLETI
ncbi:hypothetical protein I3760_12G034400 [Carya illinoinensis]|nr:hypothetical protein I3760_12G034400 [Carya illinoinensis]